MNLREAEGLERNHKALPAENQYRTAAERRMEGKALRDRVPREEHGGWKAPKGRRDPVELVPALEVWYDRIDLESLIDRLAKESGNEEMRARGKERLEKARSRSVAEHDFPKLVEHHGASPKIKDNPPLIFHPSEELAPGYLTRYAEATARYRESLPEHVRVLFDRFHFFDLAIKVVGVGSVGTQCSVGLFMAADDDPLFLQIKEARASVLEPYAGRSLHPNHGQRVIAGQRLMQSASDIFLGWTTGKDPKNYYVRQLRDMKLSAIIEDWDDNMLRAYSKMCALALARAHARSGDAAMISGSMGSNATFDDAICEFAVEYADQTQRDHRAFVKAVREGRVKAIVES